MENSVLVMRKKRFSIRASVNPVTKKLYDFVIHGPGLNPHVTYTHVSSPERIVNKMTAEKK